MRGHSGTWRPSCQHPREQGHPAPGVLPTLAPQCLRRTWAQGSSTGKPPAPRIVHGGGSSQPAACPHTTGVPHTPSLSLEHHPGPRVPLLPALPAPLCLVISAKIPVFVPRSLPSAQVCFWLDTTRPQATEKGGFCLKNQGCGGRPARLTLSLAATRQPRGSDQRLPRAPREARPPPANGSGRAGGYLHTAGGRGAQAPRGQ